MSPVPQLYSPGVSLLLNSPNPLWYTTGSTLIFFACLGVGNSMCLCFSAIIVLVLAYAITGMINFYYDKFEGGTSS